MDKPVNTKEVPGNIGKPAASRSDYGTLILHWTAAAAVAASLRTGLRIGADSVTAVIPKWFEPILPQGEIWTWHVVSALVRFFSATAYVVYMVRSGLQRRITLRRARVLTMEATPRMKWGAINLLLHWALYGLVVLLTLTGAALYLGYGGWIVIVHLVSALVMLAYILVHVAAHLIYGGWDEILRVFRPGPLAEKKGALGWPLAYASVLGVVLVAAVSGLDWASRSSLSVAGTSSVPKLDGMLDDATWKNAEVVTVLTQQGVNLGRTGTSAVEIRAVHDTENIYFAFRWQDATRSIRRHPVIKQEDGWHILTEHGDLGDEIAFYEDKFSVVFSGSPAFGGGNSTHLGPHPLRDKPAPLHGRGAHYTTDGSYVDMWQWQSSRGGLLGYINDEHFGPPVEPKPEHVAGKVRYKAGNDDDPGEGIYSYTYVAQPPGGYRGPVQIKRLPKDYAAYMSTFGSDYKNPESSDPEGARWWMLEQDTVEYSPEADAAIPVGTVIPGVIIAGQYEGDRADVTVGAHWENGWWTLETSRKLATGSKFDWDFSSRQPGYMWVGVFDHNQTRHSRHMRPVRLAIE